MQVAEAEIWATVERYNAQRAARAMVRRAHRAGNGAYRLRHAREMVASARAAGHGWEEIGRYVPGADMN